VELQKQLKQHSQKEAVSGKSTKALEAQVADDCILPPLQHSTSQQSACLGAQLSRGTCSS
jgi:hypothetical protein